MRLLTSSLLKMPSGESLHYRRGVVSSSARARSSQLHARGQADSGLRQNMCGWRLAAACLALLAAIPGGPLAASSPGFGYHIAGDEQGSWARILSAVGFVPGQGVPARVYVVRDGTADAASQWLERVSRGALVVLEGDTELSRAVGIQPGTRQVVVRSVVDEHRPRLPIIWERALTLPFYTVPPKARVYARERWEKAPLVAGFRQGAGGVLWVAVTPGEKGHERFPFLLHALQDLGLSAPFRSARLWAFFDASYRSRVDVDYFAARWRAAGIGALLVASWQFHEPDAERDAYLSRLIEACHARGILVYAWIGIPHVSERFWEKHPEWREKTALLQDAHLDWRRLMNVLNRDCFNQVAVEVHSLIDRFDWDGVNLSEVYFESLEGHGNPARFTPLNDDVRREFQSLHGFDPLALFQRESSWHYAANEKALRAFLDYRSELARRLQVEWIDQMEQARRRKPHLDLVLTHVDDRFDTRMRDLIGADAAALMPLLERYDFTFLIEDPATVWHLGPERYTQIAERYKPLTPRQEKLAIDINIVERYQDVYPTKQQIGTELFKLVHLASRAFPRVALYFENSLLPPDLALLPSAAAVVDRVEYVHGKLVVESPRGVGVAWEGPARVDGRPWAAGDGRTLWLPPGPHVIEPAEKWPDVRLLDFNGDLETVHSLARGVEFTYRSSSRAFAILNARPKRVEIDGQQVEPRWLSAGAAYSIYLPRGQHLVTVTAE